MENNPNNKPSIIDKLKKSPATVIAVLLAAVIVLSVVAVASVMNAKKPDKPVLPGNDPLAIQKETERFDKLQNDIKLMLFNANITKDSIAETVIQNGDTKEIHTKITVDADRAAEILVQAEKVIDANNMKAVYVSGNSIEIAALYHKYRLAIEERAVQIPDTPVVTIPPVSNNPSLKLPPKGSGKIALLIDDAGMNLHLAERLLKQQVPMALAILPHQPYSRETADLVREKGQTVFLHFPMEPLSYPSTDPGPGAVLLNMPELLIHEIAKQNVENLGSIDGFNNHTGSAFTEDAAKMTQVLEGIRDYTTYFVDSNTSPKTVALKTCQEIGGFKCGLNKKFLDNENDHDYIRQKLYDAAEFANKNGSIITIGHLRPDTVAVLEETIAQLQALGYEFVSIKSLMK